MPFQRAKVFIGHSIDISFYILEIPEKTDEKTEIQTKSIILMERVDVEPSIYIG